MIPTYREVLADAIRSLSPHYSLMDKCKSLGLGYYQGGMNDGWVSSSSWKYEHLSDRELEELYIELKNCWKK